MSVTGKIVLYHRLRNHGRGLYMFSTEQHFTWDIFGLRCVESNNGSLHSFLFAQDIFTLLTLHSWVLNMLWTSRWDVYTHPISLYFITDYCGRDCCYLLDLFLMSCLLAWIFLSLLFLLHGAICPADWVSPLQFCLLDYRLYVTVPPSTHHCYSLNSFRNCTAFSNLSWNFSKINTHRHLKFKNIILFTKFGSFSPIRRASPTFPFTILAEIKISTM